MNLSQRQLRLFVTTARLLNMSRAAEALHISQPALTRAVQELESQLGVALFHRTTRRIELSRDGERLLPVAQRLLRDMDRIVADVRDSAAGLSGDVTMAVGSAFGCTILAPALRRLAMTHPRVRVCVTDRNSAGITRQVVTDEADIGVGSAVGDTALLDCTPLLEAPIGVLVNETVFQLPQILTSDALTRCPLLKEPEDSSIVHALRAQGSPLVAMMSGGTEVDSLALQLAFARAGVGGAVVSALGASHPAARGLRFSPLQPRLPRRVFLMRRRDRPLSAAAAALVEAIDAALASEPLHEDVIVLRSTRSRTDLAHVH